MFSTIGCTALALGTVVITRSSRMTLVVRFLRRLLRAPISRLSLAFPNLCLIILRHPLKSLGKLVFVRAQVRHHIDRRRGRSLQATTGVGLHTEAKAHAAEDFLDFAERLAPEILGAKHFRF